MSEVDTKVSFQDLQNNFFVMAGPNVIESEEHVIKMAKELKVIFEQFKDQCKFIFKVSFDKANRSSITSYRGVGFEEGMRILKRVRDEVDVPIITDVHEPWQVEEVAKVADIIQVPAFLCRQTDLLKAVAESNRIIHVKKAQFLDVAAMHKCVEKINAFGNNKVILCERGTMFGYKDLVVDSRNLQWMHSDKNKNLVSMDITHCLQQPSQVMPDGTVRAGGLREFIPNMGYMAVINDVNGVFMEVHDRPDESLCDAPTQFPLTNLQTFLTRMMSLRNFCQENDIYTELPQE
jgi:2-dehydro-3-deoxyphosphooctonate aldolase (KDO 8-P synthase)